MKARKTCFEREELFAYSSQMLAPQEGSRIKAHLGSCAACRDIVSGYQRLDRALDEWKPAEPSPWFDARVRVRIAAGTHSWRFVSDFRAWAGVAAVAVLVVVTSFVVLRPSRPSHSPRPAAVAPVQTVAKAAPGNLPASTAQTATAAARAETDTVAETRSANQEIDLYKNLNVLENYDMLANFDVLSELPQAGDKTSD